MLEDPIVQLCIGVISLVALIVFVVLMPFPL
jgi:hypothetical protein